MNKSIRRKPIINPISLTVLVVLLATNILLYVFASINQKSQVFFLFCCHSGRCHSGSAIFSADTGISK